MGLNNFWNYFDIYAHILLTKSNNQTQNYESWILNFFLTNKIAFDKKVITNGKISENSDSYFWNWLLNPLKPHIGTENLVAFI